jgi:hypothetical protein
VHRFIGEVATGDHRYPTRNPVRRLADAGRCNEHTEMPPQQRTPQYPATLRQERNVEALKETRLERLAFGCGIDLRIGICDLPLGTATGNHANHVATGVLDGVARQCHRLGGRQDLGVGPPSRNPVPHQTKKIIVPVITGADRSNARIDRNGSDRERVGRRRVSGARLLLCVGMQWHRRRKSPGDLLKVVDLRPAVVEGQELGLLDDPPFLDRPSN